MNVEQLFSHDHFEGESLEDFDARLKFEVASGARDKKTGHEFGKEYCFVAIEDVPVEEAPTVDLGEGEETAVADSDEDKKPVRKSRKTK
jgi:hypothetical protein